MKTLLTLGAAAAALAMVAITPAGAADRKANGAWNENAVTTDMSAQRRRYRRYRGYRPYYRPYYYGGYPYGYYGSPYRYGYYRPYYRPPGLYFGFGF